MTDPKRVQANGIDIAYLEAGPDDGPLALCLHGFPDHAPTWQHLMPELAAAGYHVVAPWLRGYSPTGLPMTTTRSPQSRSTRSRWPTSSAPTATRC